MDKKFLLRLNDTFKTIKTTLLLNDNLRTLLFYDEIDEDTVAPPIQVAAEHVFLQPVIKTETTEPFNKKNYISITGPEAKKRDNRVVYILRVIVMCDKSTWMVNNNIRPLLIAQEIINTINGVKFQLSGALELDGIVETVTSPDVTGYSILFDVVDGISDTDAQ